MFIRDHLDCDTLFGLRANREQVNKVDSNGDFFVRMYTLLDEKPIHVQADMLKPRNFNKWLIQVFGASEKKFPHFTDSPWTRGFEEKDCRLLQDSIRSAAL